MQIKYRVGVMPGPWPAGPEGAAFLWRLVDLCETTEIDSLWFSERLSSPLPVPEPMTTLAAVAARTRRLKFGPSVFITPFRNPVTAAREIAMIDYLSGGRMLPAFGIGVEQEREFHAAGVPFKERGRRTDEALAIPRRRPRPGRAVHPAQPCGRRDARDVHGLRPARAVARAPRGIRGRRRLEIHRPADVPARPDARAAAAARRRGRPRLSPPVSVAAEWMPRWSPSKSKRRSRAGRPPRGRC